MLAKLFTAAMALVGSAVSTPLSLDKRVGSAVGSAGPQVVIDPAGVYIRVVRMNDDSLLAGYARTEGSQHVLRTSISKDEGASWQELGEVFRDDKTLHDIDNAFPLQLPNGRVLYAFRNHDRTSDGRYTYFRLTVCYSDDGGVTFHYLSQIDERPAASYKNGLWEPYFYIAKDGNIQVYYSSENNGGDQDNLMKYSSDGGKTWQGPIIVSGGETGTSRDGMTGVAPFDGNKLMVIFECTEDGPFSVNYVVSEDGGYTWGQRTRLYTAANGRDAGAPQVYNVWGTLVASFETNEDSPGLPAVNGGVAKALVSADSGATWKGPYQIAGQHSHWPGLFNLNSNHFLALYSIDGKGAVSQKYELV